ncbi:MAG: hypothetical protein QNJ31_05035 [Candidatus Caenarcaniphilales bacterium]|nr:hypothetical protein [Candidatus Caenarcaniphilales bacterium]
MKIVQSQRKITSHPLFWIAIGVTAFSINGCRSQEMGNPKQRKNGTQTTEIELNAFKELGGPNMKRCLQGGMNFTDMSDGIEKCSHQTYEMIGGPNGGILECSFNSSSPKATCESSGGTLGGSQEFTVNRKTGKTLISKPQAESNNNLGTSSKRGNVSINNSTSSAGSVSATINGRTVSVTGSSLTVQMQRGGSSTSSSGGISFSNNVIKTDSAILDVRGKFSFNKSFNIPTRVKYWEYSSPQIQKGNKHAPNFIMKAIPAYGSDLNTSCLEVSFQGSGSPGLPNEFTASTQLTRGKTSLEGNETICSNKDSISVRVKTKRAVPLR